MSDIMKCSLYCKVYEVYKTSKNLPRFSLGKSYSLSDIHTETPLRLCSNNYHLPFCFRSEGSLSQDFDLFSSVGDSYDFHSFSDVVIVPYSSISESDEHYCSSIDNNCILNFVAEKILDFESYYKADHSKMNVDNKETGNKMKNKVKRMSYTVSGLKSWRKKNRNERKSDQIGSGSNTPLCEYNFTNAEIYGEDIHEGPSTAVSLLSSKKLTTENPTGIKRRNSISDSFKKIRYGSKRLLGLQRSSTMKEDKMKCKYNPTAHYEVDEDSKDNKENEISEVKVGYNNKCEVFQGEELVIEPNVKVSKESKHIQPFSSEYGSKENINLSGQKSEKAIDKEFDTLYQKSIMSKNNCDVAIQTSVRRIGKLSEKVVAVGSDVELINFYNIRDKPLDKQIPTSSVESRQSMCSSTSYRNNDRTFQGSVEIRDNNILETRIQNTKTSPIKNDENKLEKVSNRIIQYDDTLCKSIEEGGFPSFNGDRVVYDSSSFSGEYLNSDVELFVKTTQNPISKGEVVSMNSLLKDSSSSFESLKLEELPISCINMTDNDSESSCGSYSILSDSSLAEEIQRTKVTVHTSTVSTIKTPKPLNDARIRQFGSPGSFSQADIGISLSSNIDITDGNSKLLNNNKRGRHQQKKRSPLITRAHKSLPTINEDTVAVGPDSGKCDHLFKILVIGNFSTGKTSIIKRYVHQYYSDHYKATVGVDFAVKVINWDEDNIVRLQLWDIAGQERYSAAGMTRVYFKEAVGAFVVIDVTDDRSLDAAKRWKKDLDDKVTLPNGSPIPVVLLANKCDKQRHVKLKRNSIFDDACRESGFNTWFETSAKDNINIEDSARYLVNKIMNLQKDGNMSESSQDYGRISIGSDTKEKTGWGCLC